MFYLFDQKLSEEANLQLEKVTTLSCCLQVFFYLLSIGEIEF